MNKQAPTFGRLLIMVLFTVSCFGLLLFLWISFGGATPLAPKGYRFQVAVPEANQLAVEADVRIAGVPVGKVRAKERLAGRTLVTVELDRRYAPLDRDARVIQRSKTLLGERYLELTRGRPGGPTVPESGRLPDARVEETVELDEVLGALDAPTQKLFRIWQQDLGAAVRPSGPALNDAFGTLPRFAAKGTDVLEVLDSQSRAVTGLLRDTGVVFEALTRNEGQLRNLVVNTDQVFSATASRRESLAETFRIFPTFLDESRATVEDLRTFARQARPVLRDLRPGLRDARPTLRDARAFAPDLERLYRDLDPLIDASKTGLPALSDTLRGLVPVLGKAQPFLEELNPILEFLEVNQHQVADFLQNGAGALADKTSDPSDPNGAGHYLGQYGVTGEESFAIQRNRQTFTRGNAYLGPIDIINGDPRRASEMIFPNFDCRNTKTGGPVSTRPGDDDPSCFVGKNLPGMSGRYPHVVKADYGEGR
jgi:virulence factor Mce-like protein